MFYTKDHEWIDFQGLIAYVGISNFKLLKFKTINEIRLREPLAFARAREVFAWIGQIFEHLERSGWLISIAPVSTSERKELISYEQYHASIVHVPNP